jgi:hypothetical protein
MNGLIKSSMLGDIGSFGALAVAFVSVSAAFYVIIAGFAVV